MFLLSNLEILKGEIRERILEGAFINHVDMVEGGGGGLHQMSILLLHKPY